MKTSLEHLPEHKREQLAAMAAVLAAEAPVEMVILFGSHARGDWVEDPENGYFSDYDLLAVTATEAQAHDAALWSDMTARVRALSGRTPVTLIAHDIKEINHELRLGQYFFIDILREGVVVHDSRRFSLVSPKALTPPDRLQLGLINFRYWFASATEFWRTAGYSAGRGNGPQAAFLLHQATERFFGATLLVFTGYKPKSHNIEDLANETAPLHPALPGALPRTAPADKALFTLLKRGYIDARYSKSYKITPEELRTLRTQVHDLATRVHTACTEKLASFCGPDQVGPLPPIPALTETPDLPAAPSPDNPAAFQSWQEALTSLAFERGEQQGFDRGEQQGFDRGKQAGITEGVDRGRRETVLRLLRKRFGELPEDAIARVNAADGAMLEEWTDRVLVAETLADVWRER